MAFPVLVELLVGDGFGFFQRILGPLRPLGVVGHGVPLFLVVWLSCPNQDLTAESSFPDPIAEGKQWTSLSPKTRSN
jgi:hypothetical protein